MIRLRREPSGSITMLGAPEGTIAYADREWLADDFAEAACLAVLPDRQVVLPDGHTQELSSDDADVAAARFFMAIAREAAAIVGHVPPSAAQVVGRGIVATIARSYAGIEREQVATGKPAAVVETTGRQDAIFEACRRVADLGLVVLAGEPAGRRTELNLYPDVHVRGLTLVGAPTTEGIGLLPGPADDHEGQIEADALAQLQRVAAGARLPDGTWFRID